MTRALLLSIICLLILFATTSSGADEHKPKCELGQEREHTHHHDNGSDNKQEQRHEHEYEQENDLIIDERAKEPEPVVSKRELRSEDWAPTHYKIFSSSVNYMKPAQTLEVLKQLQEIYEPFTNAETNGRKEKVKSLVQAADMNPLLCVREYLEAFVEMNDYYTPFRKTIVPYLGHQLADFLSVCEDSAHNNLRVAVLKDMDPVYRTDMETYARITAELDIDGVVLAYKHLDKLWRFSDHLVEGTINFLQEKFGSKLNAKTYVKHRNGKTLFYDLMEKHIFKMCQEWIKALDPVEALKDFDIFLKFDEREFRWLMYGHMCRHINTHKEKVKSKVFRQFRRHVSTLSGIRLAFHKNIWKLINHDHIIAEH